MGAGHLDKSVPVLTRPMHDGIQHSGGGPRSLYPITAFLEGSNMFVASIGHGKHIRAL